MISAYFHNAQNYLNRSSPKKIRLNDSKKGYVKGGENRQKLENMIENLVKTINFVKFFD